MVVYLLYCFICSFIKEIDYKSCVEQDFFLFHNRAILLNKYAKVEKKGGSNMVLASEIYAKRKESIERVFADAKEKHGMR